MMIYQLLYKSCSNGFLHESQFNQILKQSRANNILHDITGLLLYRDKVFVQLLEGPEEKVEQTFEKIVDDPRHRNIDVILTTTSDKRIFPSWEMGHFGEEFLLENYANLSSILEITASHGKIDQELIVKILRSFTSKKLF